MTERYLVTSALPYANGPVHIGHIAGAYLPADIFVRYLRMNGNEVVFICGTDEHGVPITIRAENEGLTPKDVVERYHNIIGKSFRDMGICFDNFSGTSRHIHHETSQEFFTTLLNNGALTIKEETGFYSEKMNMFLPDRYIEGECPICKFHSARGDQCEKCGSMLTPVQLINPVSKIDGQTPILKNTKHYYMKLGDFQAKLENFIDSKKTWKPNVINYCKNWFKEGLNDRAITRDLSWGIKVPVDEKGFESKVIYVWFEAPIGYISSTKEWAQKIGEPERWKRYWHGKETKIVHFIGKDNIVFHALMFPATLMAAGEQWNLVHDIPANEFLNIENEKISTSRDWAVWVDEYLEELPPDPLRYYLAYIAPENSDSDFTWEGFVKHNNSDLADVIGNYVNRVVTFVHKNFDGKIPEKGILLTEDIEIIEKIKDFCNNSFLPSLSQYKCRKYATDFIETFKSLNKYFNDLQPWHLIKSDTDRCATVLWTCIKVLRDMTVMMYPLMPFSAEKIWKTIGERKSIAEERWGTFLGCEPEEKRQTEQSDKNLFVKYDDAFIEMQKAKIVERAKRRDESLKAESEKREKSKQAVDETKEVEQKSVAVVDTVSKSYEPIKSEISIEDFIKIDIRSATIVSAQRVEKSDKLIKMEVDLGFEKRTIVGGLGNDYTPEELENKKVMVVANLKPRKLMGIESRGMLLAVSQKGDISLLCADITDVEPGNCVG